MRRARSVLTPTHVAVLALMCALAAGPAPAQSLQGPQVKLVTPRIDQPLADPIVIQALVRALPGRTVASVQAFLDDQDLGLRARPPYRWVVPLAANAAAVHVRIVAIDSTGAQSQVEEMVTRLPGMRFEAEVPAVTLNLAALDGNERWVSDLEPTELSITDNGEPQEIIDFARGEAPLRVAILVDQSNSMRDKMPETIAALTEFVRQLGPDDQVKLMAFNERVTSYTPFTNMHDLVASFAQAIRAEGGTALYDALLYGHRQLANHQDARERRAIFLLTDGDDQSSRNALAPALERVRNSGVTVFALGQGDALDSGDLRDVLRRMAEQTGGAAFFEKDKSRLDAVFVDIAAAMRALYLVSYRPSNPVPGWHEIAVEVSRPGLTLRHKPGYERSSSQHDRYDRSPSQEAR
jgi:VWFA-related protein